VRCWQEGDTAAINRLYNDPVVRQFGGLRGYTPRTDAQWRWEFAATCPGDPAYAVATHDERIIGTQAYIPIELLHDGEIILSGKDEDTLVHPDYRGMGVLDEMYRVLFDRAQRDGVKVLWGFTSTAVASLVRNGFRTIGRFAAMRADLSKAQRPRGTNPRPTGGGLIVRRLDSPDDECTRFSLAFGRQVGGIMVHLSGEFLRWRVYDNPFRRYEVYAAFEEGRLIGLAAFKFDQPQRVGYVSELAALNTEINSLAGTTAALLRSGLTQFREEGLRFAECRPSGEHPFNQEVRSVLARCGFAELPLAHAPEFLVRPVGGDDGRLLDMARWRISEIMREY
jgi:GNAT superfamily N-acetyltransferase